MQVTSVLEVYLNNRILLLIIGIRLSIILNALALLNVIIRQLIANTSRLDNV
jgi:hypothetical protein